MNFKIMLMCGMVGMNFFCHVMASDMQGSLQRTPSINNETVVVKLLNFQRLLIKADNQDSQIKLTTSDYQQIKHAIHSDIETLFGNRGIILLDIKTDERTSCYSHCIKEAAALYMDLLSSGYESSVYEKRHAHADCKITIESALDVLKNENKDSSMKRD